MKFIYAVLAVGVALALRVFVARRRQQRRTAVTTARALQSVEAEVARHLRQPGPGRPSATVSGDVGLVALREIRERVRGRIFRVGTIVILLAVGAAIVIPAIHKNSAAQPQKVGVVVPNSAVASVHTLVNEIAASVGITGQGLDRTVSLGPPRPPCAREPSTSPSKPTGSW